MELCGIDELHSQFTDRLEDELNLIMGHDGKVSDAHSGRNAGPRYMRFLLFLIIDFHFIYVDSDAPVRIPGGCH